MVKKIPKIDCRYLFQTNNPCCPAETSLWGFHNKTSKGIIYLEHSTDNLRCFRLWHRLPNAIVATAWQHEMNLEIICTILVIEIVLL